MSENATSTLCPVWSDGQRLLYQGDSRLILPSLEAESFDTLVTDPPYGEGLVTGDDDMQTSQRLLSEVLVASMPLLRPGGHAVVFSSSRGLHSTLQAMTVAGLEFRRVLFMKIKQGNARPWRGWLLRSQPIIIARKPGRYFPQWRQDCAAMLRAAMTVAQLTPSALAKQLGVSPRLVYKWTREDDPAWSYPSVEHGAMLSTILGIPVPEQPVQPKCTESVRNDVYEVSGKSTRNSKHPCPKPVWVIEDIIRRLPGRILDPFAGSGTILEAAKRADLPCVGIEIEEEHCRSAIEWLDRSKQKNFDFPLFM